MSWYLKVLKQYAVFQGRARRKEYWMFILIHILVFMALAFVDAGTGTLDAEAGYGLLSGLYSLGVLIPGLAVAVRRLHDTGRSGWWILIGIIPVIGVLVLLFFFVQDSDEGSNEYGANPKRTGPPAGATNI